MLTIKRSTKKKWMFIKCLRGLCSLTLVIMYNYNISIHCMFLNLHTLATILALSTVQINNISTINNNNNIRNKNRRSTYSFFLTVGISTEEEDDEENVEDEFEVVEVGRGKEDEWEEGKEGVTTEVGIGIEIEGET